ncbi:MAG TPA: inositol monophosphatase family protein [Actinomycetota bacterium]|nr:inositol monophosphatase family protein [Actinomycetota bacterium]
MDDDLAFALELTDLADSITMARFGAPDLIVESKRDESPVTDVDREVERVLRGQIEAARPGDAVVGEELGARGEAASRWVIDPIDATKNYVRGIPVFATLIALQVDGVGKTAVISAPALGRRWWAARGAGAYVGRPTDTAGKRIRVSRVERLEDAQVCYSSLRTWEDAGTGDRLLELQRRAWRTRGFGDFWMHCLVAEGAADVAVEAAVSLWDLAAIQVLVEEAGGRFTDLGGRATPDGGSAVSSNALLHDEVLSIVSGPGATGGP